MHSVWLAVLLHFAFIVHISSHEHARVSVSSPPNISPTLAWTEKVNNALKDFPEIWDDKDNSPTPATHVSTDKKEQEIDESLYSRQLIVYGKSAQRKLMSAHIAVFVDTEHDDPLTEEIVKNLVLAGVGRISLVRLNTQSVPPPKKKTSILGEDETLVKYAHALNPHVSTEEHKVESIATMFDHPALQDTQLLIVANAHIDTLLDVNVVTRQRGIKLCSGSVLGLSGFVFNDFIEHEIVDVDGEGYKEVPLQSTHKQVNDTLLSIKCIDEEELRLGQGDLVCISSSLDPTHVYPAIVDDVLSTKSVIVRLTEERFDMRGYVEVCRELVLSGKASIKKIKQSHTIQHEPLVTQLSQQSFAPTNACLSKKHDKALSFSLFHAMRAMFTLQRAVRELSRCCNSNCSSSSSSAATEQQTRLSFLLSADERFFAELVREHLHVHGVDDPLLPLKHGGAIGQETLENTVSRFFRSAVRPWLRSARTREREKEKNNATHTHTHEDSQEESELSANPGAVSVVGALLSQEVIKALTGMYSPVSQWQLFESLDNLPLSTAENDEESVSYGEALRELQRMKVFVVGAGAIGCELLKNFALLGVGSAAAAAHNASHGSERSADEVSLWDVCGLSEGGILITDMDTIERSNLNRQLLFRENHIGQLKSIVAAQQAKQINDKIRIHALSSKVAEETSNLFPSQFWKEADVVVTALDNVDARRYVDLQCLQHKTFLVDSGTLGAKANVQVVLPFLSETYSDSADPPDESIPICTLKSFPYQPEHCVAWARNQFDQFLRQDVANLLQLYKISTVDASERLTRVDDFLSSLSKEDTENLQQMLFFLHEASAHTDEQETRQSLVRWSLCTFHRVFYEEIDSLLKEHPLDEMDDEGVLFWSGSRRIPSPTLFDENNSDHVAFVKTLSMLRWNALFPSRTLTMSDCAENTFVISTERETDLFSGREDAQSLQKIVFEFVARLPSTQSTPQAVEFEKDDLSLGHVELVKSATNIRCSIYSLRPLDTLSVQKVAGNIVAAVATTTALAAGLVSLEVLKIAAERVALRKASARIGSSLSRSELVHERQSSVLSKVRSMFRMRSPSTDEEKENKNKNAKNDAVSHAIDHALHATDRETLRLFMQEQRERLLRRFRNSFVNLAQGMVAYTQPVAASEFSVSSHVFTVWDDVELPNGDASIWTLKKLMAYLFEKYRFRVNAISLGDQPLFLHFLPHADELSRETMESLMRHAMGDEKVERLLATCDCVRLEVLGDVWEERDVVGEDGERETVVHEDRRFPLVVLRLRDEESAALKTLRRSIATQRRLVRAARERLSPATSGVDALGEGAADLDDFPAVDALGAGRAASDELSDDAAEDEERDRDEDEEESSKDSCEDSSPEDQEPEPTSSGEEGEGGGEEDDGEAILNDVNDLDTAVDDAEQLDRESDQEIDNDDDDDDENNDDEGEDPQKQRRETPSKLRRIADFMFVAKRKISSKKTQK